MISKLLTEIKWSVKPLIGYSFDYESLRNSLTSKMSYISDSPVPPVLSTGTIDNLHITSSFLVVPSSFSKSNDEERVRSAQA